MEDLKFEGSFSFAGSDFMNSSSFAFFSDHEDEHGENDEYIEIALDHHKSTVEDDEEGDLHELDYLRISFSSTTVPFHEFTDHVNSSAADVTVNETPSSSSSSSSSAFTAESSSSTATTYKDRPLLGSESESGRFHKTRRRRSSHMPRILDPPSSETGKRNENSHNGDLLPNRKSSKVQAASAMNGGMMMKLLIKIRGIKLGTLFASFLKPRGSGVVVHRENIVNHTTTDTNTNNNNNNNNNRTSESAEYYRRMFMKPLVKWLIQRNTDNDTTKSAAAGVGGDHKYSKLMNINGAMRGVLRAMSFTKLDNITNNSKSCPSPTSINSSSVLHHHNNGSPTTTTRTKPDHYNKLYTRDNSISIQAAIAHCKTSFSTSFLPTTTTSPPSHI